MLTQYTIDMLERKCLMLDLPANVMQWVVDLLEGLQIQFNNPQNAWLNHDQDLHTQNQIGYLAGLMDLEREDRLEMLSILVGFPLYYNGEDFPNAVPLEQVPLERRTGPSSKDIRITKLMHNVLIEFYSNNPDAHLLNETLGYESLTDKRSKKRLARFLTRQTKAAEREARRLARANKSQPAPSST